MVIEDSFFFLHHGGLLLLFLNNRLFIFLHRLLLVFNWLLLFRGYLNLFCSLMLLLFFSMDGVLDLLNSFFLLHLLRLYRCLLLRLYNLNWFLDFLCRFGGCFKNRRNIFFKKLLVVLILNLR
jgi:hypothetical protein